MYAIIKTGGKQYRVVVGDVIDIDLQKDTNEKGAKIEFGEVLFASDGSQSHVGSPSIAQFLVEGEVIGDVKGEKVTGLKYKPNHTVCRKWGHRQKYTRIKITKIGHQEKVGKHGN